ncbi:hypothetical protein [Kitasatospora sp. NPDC088351]|uniref:hypothetical protein n=1 Tax=Kitasatospora sp. NPDC088351 TaxID=3155180 RepID=UPI00343FA7D2
MTSTASHSAAPPPGRPGPADGTADGTAHGRASVPGPAASGAGSAATSWAASWAAGDGDGRLPVGPRGPWSVRTVRAGRGRAALEVYEHGELVDVLVAARLTSQLLCAARRCVADDADPGSGGNGRRAHGIAWGRLPQDGTAPTVGFTAGRLRWLGRPARITAAGHVVAVAGEFWLAWAEGSFDGVLVEHSGEGVRERRPLKRIRRHATRVGTGTTADTGTADDVTDGVNGGVTGGAA